MADATDARRPEYLLLTAVAVAICCARVFGAELVYEPSRFTPPPGGYSAVPPDPPRPWPAERPEPSPMFSSNDKSRWATVRALVDEGTYAIGRRTYPDGRNPKRFTDDGLVTDPLFRSVDVVLRPLGDHATGPQVREFYSSKPPLFPTLVAAEYWLLKQLFGWDLVRDRFRVVPVILVTVNVVPFLIYLALLARLIDQTATTDFGRLLTFATAAVGTFLVTFAGTLNNHLPAAFCVLFASYPLLRAVHEKRDMTAAGYFGCGFFAALAASFDLPATAFLAGLGLPLLLARPRPTLLVFLPAALIPVLALLVCNYAALGQWLPAYSEFGGPWYTFEGSHWAKRGTPAGKGIDFNTEPTTVYAFHLLFGHHGWFSLTPVWLLAAGGLVARAAGSAADLRRLVARPVGTGWTPELFAALTLVVSVVVFGFYLTRTQSYNYGGFTSGPRWLFWLIPLWVLALPPAADRLGRWSAGRWLAALLLSLAVFSAFYPLVNPWRHPWLLNLLEFTGVKRY